MVNKNKNNNNNNNNNGSSGDTTDNILFVRTSGDDILNWNKEKITEALNRETGMPKHQAQVIAIEAEKFIKNSGAKFISAPLIREIVNSKLIEHGYEHYRKLHTRLGMPLYDMTNLFFLSNKENSNVHHNSEAINLTLAGHAKKEYALLNVFSEDVGKAYQNGRIHLHDLDFIDRPYCSGQSVEYLKKFGLVMDGRGNYAVAGPAKHPEVLILHLTKFAAALQGHFAGAIGWDAVNVFMAPFLVGLDESRIKQLAQMMIYEFAQQAVSRGGQVTFTDTNYYWEIPKHFSDVPAIGPGGKYTGNNYSEYLGESQAFMKAAFEVYLKGDNYGRPFFFPKPDFHVTDKFFKTEGHEEMMDLACEVGSKMGNTYFIFDRGDEAKISECCRLQFKLNENDLLDAKQPWKMRYSAMQNVTINLPRAAYAAKGDDSKLFEYIDESLELAAQAHIEKKEFIRKILAQGSAGSLPILTMDLDGEPYYRFERASFLMGMLGLNELVQFHLGEELHESNKAIKFGLKVIVHMGKKQRELSEKTGLHFALEQTPAESTAYRLAHLDRERYPNEVAKVVKGDFTTSEMYYTNSTYLNVGVPMSPIKRVTQEGMFHPLIDAGALTHVWLGDSRPDPSALGSFVKKTFTNTQNTQIAFSPEFTFCKSCHKVVRGLIDRCQSCSSVNVDGITRVTGYLSTTSNWNKGKLAELRDRYRSYNLS
ncbi:MAG: anaerobic ribonucleoside-triphosphate reductase [DPANN group archaeon]|nr:anaerobic ribonucleoside-triphosphate reductase [DPANN group archaeon]